MVRELVRRLSRWAVNDPTGPGSGVYRVMRGGTFINSLGYCHSAMRSCIPAAHEGTATGVRVALVPARTVEAAAPVQRRD